MKFSKFIIIPIMIAALAFTLQAVDQAIASLFQPANVGFGWIAFQAWAMYFLAGCDIKGGVKSFLGYVSGVAASIAIMSLGGVFASLGYWALPVAVFIVVIPVISLEKVKWFDLVPATFVGAGAFFGFMSYIPDATFSNATIVILAYCLIGLLYGFVTVTLRTKYEASLVKEPVTSHQEVTE
ncbi:MAG: DUF1097 domain-containing protein [Erysipelotrichaceae bacterium]